MISLRMPKLPGVNHKRAVKAFEKSGSCHLIQTEPEAGGVNIQVDCGIARGHDPVLPFEQWPVAPSAMPEPPDGVSEEMIARIPPLLPIGSFTYISIGVFPNLQTPKNGININFCVTPYRNTAFPL
jgi:hypothetical protein